MHRETGAYHKKFLGHNQKWLTQFFSFYFFIDFILFLCNNHKQYFKGRGGFYYVTT